MDAEALVARQQRHRRLTERVVAHGPTFVLRAHDEAEPVELPDDVALLAPRRMARQRHPGERVAAFGRRARHEGDEPVVGSVSRGRAREQQRVPARLVDEVADLGVRSGGRRVPRQREGGLTAERLDLEPRPERRQ